MKVFMMILVTLALLTVSCDDNDTTILRDCQIGFGQSSDCGFDGLDLFFQEVSDSRCPIGVVCVWEGEVKIELLVNNSDTARLALTPGEPELSRDTIGEYILELVDVLPFPEDGVVINDEDIVAEIKVQR